MNEWDFGGRFELLMGKRFYTDARIPYGIPRLSRCPLKLAARS